MDTSTLRWILILIGVIIVASIFLFGNPDRKRKPKASRLDEGEARDGKHDGKREGKRRGKRGEAERREPTLDGGKALAAAEDSGAAAGQGELNIGAPPPPPRPPRPRKPAGPPPEKIVSLFLLARDKHSITGAQLLQATVNTGMAYGDMDIFHRVPEGTDRPVFSLANATKPGHFDRDAWNTFETAGLVLFMALPGPVYALDAWDSMLATARRMSELLHAELLDDQHNAFTRQREAQIREEMRDFDRRKSRQG